MIDYGFVEGSVRKEDYYRKNTTDADRNLNFRDIHGNKCNTRSLGNFHSRDRR